MNLIETWTRGFKNKNSPSWTWYYRKIKPSSIKLLLFKPCNIVMFIKKLSENIRLAQLTKKHNANWFEMILL